ncbi:hypothetical protein AB0I10_21820 [Streptomyces sp. NPDC050636]|uniref:hypothetical protein n=1 Tax=Streptomyces sp. NPDC050636 TaxID=3154510 RepID=UPI00343DCA4B
MDVLDLGLKALLNWIAGNRALSTGVGAAAAAPFYALSVLQVVRVMDRWADTTANLAKATKIAAAATGAIRGSLGVALNTVNEFPVPGGSGYDNRAV